MATLDKLRIQGIRSFAPDNSYIIKFYKPLTLIVGQNGAGKTTIIESLRYATTGDFPPPNVRNAQNFIHDPNVAGEREVKAQIKLQFVDVTGHALVVTRNLSLTQKANNRLEAKTVESVIQRINDDGQKVSMSKRCNDLDRYIPSMMGVSKAVLDNVIFCHQEESNWPLSDGTILKKKFDEIFAASRYRKALDVIKKQRKEQMDDIRLYNSELEHLTHLKNQAESMKAEVGSINDKLVKYRRDNVDLEAQIEKAATEIGEYRLRVARVEELFNEKKQLETKRDLLNKNVQSIRAQVSEEFIETDEELANMSVEYETSLKIANDELASSKTRLAQLKTQYASLSSDYNRQCTEHGKINAEAELHERRIADRDAHISKTAATHSIAGYSAPPFTNEAASAFLTTLSDLATKAQNDANANEAAYRAKEEELSGRIEKMKRKQTSIDETIKIKNEQQASNRERTRATQLELDTLVRPARTLRDITLERTKDEDMVKELQAALTAANLDGSIASLAKKYRELELTESNLEVKIKTLNAQATGRARLSVKLTDRDAKEAAFNEVHGRVRSGLEALAGRVVEQKDMLTVVKKEAARRKELTAAARAKVTESSNEQSVVLKMIQTHEKAKVNLENELKDKAGRIEEGTRGRDLLELIAQAEERRDSLKELAVENEVSQKGARNVLQRLLDSGSKKKCCPLCCRDWASENEREVFATTVQGNIGKLSVRTEQGSEDLRETEALLAALLNYRADYDRCKRLASVDIPEKTNLLQEQLIKKSELAAAAVHYQEALDVAEAREKEASSLVPDVEKAASLWQEFLKLDNDVKNEERLLSVSGLTETLEDVTNSKEDVKARMVSINREMERVRAELAQRKAELHARESRTAALREEELKAKASADTEARLTATLEEISTKMSQLTVELGKLQQEKAPTTEALNALIAEHEQLHQSFKKREKTHQHEVNKYKQDFQWLKATSRDIEEYVASNKMQAAARSAEKIAALKARTEATAVEQERLQTTITNMQNNLAQVEVFKRSIADNMALRKAKNDVVSVEKQIARLVKDTEAVAPQYEAVKAQLIEMEKEHADMLSERAANVGYRSVYQDRLKGLKAELEDDKFRDIEGRHRQKLIEVKTTELANSDLIKYHNALDKALMRFHTIKMDEINKIIKELWQKTYRGNDIDTIAIRSDQEAKTNYNYRVVMIKGDVELSMRGRCSAGQKVLAGLIIRLALAETFCLNCGILALDEPTANLDRANMESFAASLAALIESRAKQNNFQLIVITHDEEFVQQLGQGQKADFYWRVTKDEEQHSQVVRMDFAAFS